MFDAKVEASFREAIRTAKEQKSVSLEKRGEASYAEYRRRKEVALAQLHCSQIAKKSGWSTFHSDCPNSWVWRDPSDWTGLNCSSASFGWFFLLGFLVALSIESGQQTGVQTYP